MDKDNRSRTHRVLELPSGHAAEIRFQCTDDKVEVRIESPLGGGSFAWDRCSEQGCLGEAAAHGTPCIRHLDRGSRAAYFEGVPKRQRISLRGVEVSQTLWDEIRESPVFQHGAPCVPLNFSGAEIRAEIRLRGVEFKHSVSFQGASVFAVMEFRECIFRQGFDAPYVYFTGAPISLYKSTCEMDVNISCSESEQSFGLEGVTFNGGLNGNGAVLGINLMNATVSGDASFRYSKAHLVLRGAQLKGLLDLSDAHLVSLSGEKLVMQAASRLGPCRAGSLYLGGATLGARIHMEVDAEEVDLSRAILKEGGLIILDRATLNLTQVSLGGPLRVAGKLPGTAVPEVIGLLNADAGKMSFARVNLSRCSMYGAHGLGSVDIESTVTFARCPWWSARRRYLADEWAWRAANPSKWRRFEWKLTGVRIGADQKLRKKGDPPSIWLPSLRASQVANTYRDLRRSLESKSDMPSASDFYYGEMEMRRRDRESGLWNRFLVTAYWLLSGYGLRTDRPAIAYFILIGLVTWAMQFHGFASGYYSVPRAAVFALRASLPGTSTLEQLTQSGQLIEVAARVLGTLLLALFLLSLRTKLMRKPAE